MTRPVDETYLLRVEADSRAWKADDCGEDPMLLIDRLIASVDVLCAEVRRLREKLRRISTETEDEITAEFAARALRPAALSAKVAAMSPEQRADVGRRLTALISEVEARACDSCGLPSDLDADTASGIILCSQCRALRPTDAKERM